MIAPSILAADFARLGEEARAVADDPDDPGGLTFYGIASHVYPADVQAMAATLTGFALASQQEPKELYKVGLGSVRFLMAFGDLMIGWRLLHQAVIAQAAIDGGATGADKSFYEGKVGVATFFAANMLPLLTGVKDIIAAIDNQAMDLDEAAF